MRILEQHPFILDFWMTKIDRDYILRNPSDTSLQDKEADYSPDVVSPRPNLSTLQPCQWPQLYHCQQDPFDQITDFSAENVSPPND